ncbi:PEPxxWA-CTERM sorting domain-containing protein [Sphingobium boeckii]|uniref:Ice-binding protein C-terminal domain-containing protein n=1 Tax=Sphingobium boeckii TaxID=1082345 RepID=A0A7W9AEW3_9SPHN|nr:PEPxxWA-CTERM sorting domain-containing protein [Sphingobium boeckii]MBB5684400.1 hypothetical protein [Sphingobium boeckii]
MKKLILAALATVAAVAPAQAAVSFSVIDGGSITFENSAGVLGVNTFDGLTVGNPFNGGVVRQGSTPFVSAEPMGSDGSKYLQIGAGQTATFTSAVGTKFFGLYIGSIDNFNKITLYDTLGGFLATFDGTQFGDPGNGDQAAPENNRWVIFEDTASSLGKVELYSDQRNAFEVDNVAFSNAVPEPATWAMMITGFGFVGGAMRRRRGEETLATA